MSAMASQITSLTIVYSNVYSGADQRKHQSSTSLAFAWGIHRWPVNSPHKGPVTWKMFPFDDVIMLSLPWISFNNNRIQPAELIANTPPNAPININLIFVTLSQVTIITLWFLFRKDIIHPRGSPVLIDWALFRYWISTRAVHHHIEIWPQHLPLKWKEMVGEVAGCQHIKGYVWLNLAWREEMNNLIPYSVVYDDLLLHEIYDICNMFGDTDGKFSLQILSFS